MQRGAQLRLKDPRQSELYDVFADIFSPVADRRLTSGWQHVFWQAILNLMPAGKLAEHFAPDMERPAKELCIHGWPAVHHGVPQLDSRGSSADESIFRFQNRHTD